MFDVIVIGAGMAGLTSAIYLARAGKKVLVLESGVVGGQIVSALVVENWPGFLKVSGADLMKTVEAQASAFGAEIKYETVLGVSKDDGFTVKTDEGEYQAQALVLAMGTEPRKLDEAKMAEVGDRPVSYCATCDGALYKDKTVVVVGSGNTAKHEIKYLEGICAKVYNIHHDEPIPAETEAVFVAIGRVPATEIVRDLVELDEDGYIVASESCVTSCPGIFAAGDCRTKTVRQLVTASSDGAVVADQVAKYLNE